jgi:hypothetical protein
MLLSWFPPIRSHEGEVKSMDTIETNRKRLNKQQTELRSLMTAPGQFEVATQLFFEQHAGLHAGRVSRDVIWSFEDAILDDLSEAQFRRIPTSCEHSIAWCIWHLARIEDTAMNILVADGAQVFNQGDWGARLGVPYKGCGNEMDDEKMLKLSEDIDLQTLRDYRAAVGRRTREIVVQLAATDLKKKVDPARIQRVLDEGAILEASRGITDYWSKRDIAGLLLMPASRHNLVHLNEALKLKKRK